MVGPRRHIPTVKVVHEHGRVRPIRSHVAGMLEPMRPIAEQTVLLAAGLWPIWAAAGFLLGLAWAMALGQAP